MSTLYQIIVENKSDNAQEFYFFQQPAIYSGGARVFTNSVGHGSLPPKGRSHNQLIFSLQQQYYAGAQPQSAPPVVGQAQVSPISQVDIDIANGAGNPQDCTKLVINDDMINLTDPINEPTVQNGAFRIITPIFNPAQNKYNIGLSATNGNGEILLSNFIEGQPNKNTDVQPIVRFYVNTGSYTPGTVVNFTASSVNAALCDATDGTLIFRVTYNADGTWTIN